MKRYIATLLLLAACASVQAREVFPLNEGWRFFFKSENSSSNAPVSVGSLSARSIFT